MTNNINDLQEQLMGDLPRFSEYEIALNFSKFQTDIEEYKKVIKKLKRKNKDFNPELFIAVIKHLEDVENDYFELMKELFTANDEEKAELIEELSFFIYNRRGIQQKMFDYEIQMINK